MSRRAPAIDDDDLDYDEGYDETEEEDLSPEDKAAMDQATAAVRTAMGADYKKLSVKDVQDSLWHYYYDIEKTVAYLRKTYLAPQVTKKPKAAPKKAPEGTSRKLSLFAPLQHDGMGTGADQEHLMDYKNRSWNNSTYAPSALPPVTSSFAGTHESFFSDMPWLDVPQHRTTTFLEPIRPRGGLLGGGDGAPKMSKLQALAAARKKKTEEKKLSLIHI